MLYHAAIPEFELSCSPMLIHPSARSYLPDSAVFVPNALKPEHPDVCVTADHERSCSVLNVACCIVSCKFHRVAIVSAYRSPSTNFVDFIDDFYHHTCLHVLTIYCCRGF